MEYLIFTDRSRAPGQSPISEQTKKDFSLIDRALADQDKRRLAEVALALTAQLVEDAADLTAEDTPLSPEDREAMALIGIDGALPLADEEFYLAGPVVEGMTRRVRLTANAIPLAQAAARIGVNDSRLRQRIAKGTLVAIPRPHGRGWLIPDFQFSEAGEIPYLARVLQALTRVVSAEALDRLFRLPHEDLEGLSPRDWLIAGRDPLPVECILSSL